MAAKPTESKTTGTRKRLPSEQRREAIVTEAAVLFSESGFSVSTRDIAKRCGLTQAALYKHFASKDALIRDVFRTRFLELDRGPFQAALIAEGVPLEERITDAYTGFFKRMGKTSQRLFLRAAMEGYLCRKPIARRWTTRFSNHWPCRFGPNSAFQHSKLILCRSKSESSCSCCTALLYSWVFARMSMASDWTGMPSGSLRKTLESGWRARRVELLKMWSDT